MSTELFSLKERICVVTGASRGLGERMAQILAQAGAVVVLTGRDKARLAAVKQDIEQAGGKALVSAFDVTDPAASTAAIDKIESDAGPIWCLVNNAGVVHMNRPENFPEHQYDEIFNTNLKAPFHLCQVVGQHMIRRGAGGRIINMASIGAFTELRGGTPYCMAKAGLVTMTKCLAVEWARYNIKVNAISPGYLRSDMTGGYFDTDRGRQDRAHWPGQKQGEARDLDGAVLLLASDAGRFMNGAIIAVDDAQPLGFQLGGDPPPVTD